MNPLEVALHAERRRLLELDVIGVYTILTKVDPMSDRTDKAFLRIEFELEFLVHELADLLPPFVKLRFVI